MDSQDYASDELMRLGMDCLLNHLGYFDTLRFIGAVRASCPDYTLWRRQVFDNKSLDDLNEMVKNDVPDNPFE